MTDFLGTGLAFPLAVDDRGRLALVSDSLDVEQAMLLIMDTAPGERPMRPEFGCAAHEFVFERLDAPTIGRIDIAIRESLDRWEPRIVVEDIAFDTSSPNVLLVELSYRLKATNGLRNLVYPFYLIPEGDE